MFSETTRKRIEQLIPRLGSDQEGDVVTAVRALRRILAADGKDFHDLARAATGEPTVVYRERPQAKPHASRAHEEPDWHAIVAECAAALDWLTEREAEFVTSLQTQLRWGRSRPTEKQAAWLAGIHARVQRRKGASA